MSQLLQGGVAVGGGVDPAVIEEARRRQRRQRRIAAGAGIAVALAAAGVWTWRDRDGGPVTSAAGARVTAAQATRCLEARGALVSRAPTVRDFPPAPAIHVSFALVPGQRADGLTISFQRDRATAAAAMASVVRRFGLRAPSIGRLLAVEKNAVVLWDAPQHSAASRGDVLACL
jgi:hypothetical protein